MKPFVLDSESIDEELKASRLKLLGEEKEEHKSRERCQSPQLQIRKKTSKSGTMTTPARRPATRHVELECAARKE